MCGPSIDTDGRVQQRFARCGVTQGFLCPRHSASIPPQTFFHAQRARFSGHGVLNSGLAARMERYQARASDRNSCPQRENCCSGNTRYGRSIVVTTEHPVVTAFRANSASPEGRTASRQRSAVAEFVNAWLKEKMGLRRFHVRGLARISHERPSKKPPTLA
jgi:DDE family transposase